MKKTLVVSLHDFHPGSLQSIDKQRQLLAGWGVERASILVIPQYHHSVQTTVESPASVAFLNDCRRQGHELVLHGFYHDRLRQKTTVKNFYWSRLYTNREAEFLDLPEPEALARINAGKKMFASQNWPTDGFIAPAWLMAPGLIDLLAQAGFTYTNTLRHLFVLQKPARRIASQSFCYSTRAAWRRKVSLSWNKGLALYLSRAALLRVSLHPRDFEFPSIRRQVERLIKDAAQSGFTPSTYRDFVQALPS
jgi:predicted deacetylase